MLGNPKFNYGDRVSFKIDGITLEGEIYIVDAYGIFFDSSDVYYDVMVDNDMRHEGGKCLYKHLPEKSVKAVKK